MLTPFSPKICVLPLSPLVMVKPWVPAFTLTAPLSASISPVRTSPPAVSEMLPWAAIAPARIPAPVTLRLTLPSLARMLPALKPLLEFVVVALMLMLPLVAVMALKCA